MFQFFAYILAAADVWVHVYYHKGKEYKLSLLTFDDSDWKGEVTVR